MGNRVTCRTRALAPFSSKDTPSLKSNPLGLRTFNYAGPNRLRLMADQLLFLASFAIGIVPALALMWLGLRRYTYPRVEKALFDDRRIFFSLAVGLVMGTLSSLISLNLPRFDLASVLIALAATAMFEETFKLVYLNRKGYRQNFSSTFYGFALGLGIAATVVLSFGLGNPNLTTDPLTFILLAMFSLGFAAMEATTGALIGYGCSKGLPWSYLLRALFARLVYTIPAVPFLLSLGPEWLIYLSIFASLGVGLSSYFFAHSITFQETLPPEFRRRARKERRARARKD